MDPGDQQGAFIAGCPFCRVLQPDVDPCPRCDGVPRLHEAQMLDEVGIGDAVARAADDYDGSRQQLDALLRVLFIYGPIASQALAADGRLDLDRLRQDDASLAE